MSNTHPVAVRRRSIRGAAAALALSLGAVLAATAIPGLVPDASAASCTPAVTSASTTLDSQNFQRVRTGYLTATKSWQRGRSAKAVGRTRILWTVSARYSSTVTYRACVNGVAGSATASTSMTTSTTAWSTASAIRIVRNVSSPVAKAKAKAKAAASTNSRNVLLVRVRNSAASRAYANALESAREQAADNASMNTPPPSPPPTPPPGPTGPPPPDGVALGTSASSLAWNDVRLTITRSTDPNAKPTSWDGIQVERTSYPDGGTQQTTVLATLPPTATSYDDSTVVANTEYTYSAVPMLNGVRQLPYQSLPVSTPAPPGAPERLTAGTATAQNSTAVVLDWSEPSTTNYAGVMIRRALGPVAPASPTDGELVIDVPSNQVTYVDTNVAPSTTYTYAMFPHSSTGSWARGTNSRLTTPAPGVGWSDATTLPFPYNYAYLETCSPSGTCHALVSGNNPGLYVRTSDGTWSREAPWPNSNSHIDSLTCAGSQVCVAYAAQSAEAFVYQAGVWGAPTVIRTVYSLPRISCASATLCLLGDSQGPYRWNGISWSLMAGLQGTNNLACAAPSFCMIQTDHQAYAFDGTTVTATNNGQMPATGQSGGPTVGIDPGALACASPTFCAIAHDRFWQTWDGTTWHRAATIPLGQYDQVGTLACGSANACVMNGLHNANGAFAFDGTTWAPYRFTAPNESVQAIGCPSSTQCLAWTTGQEYSFTNGR